MTDRDLQRELLALLPRLDIELRHMGGDMEGGLVCLRGRRVLFLNPSLSESRQLDLLCREDLSRLFLLPAVRARLETGAGQPAGTFR